MGDAANQHWLEEARAEIVFYQQTIKRDASTQASYAQKKSPETSELKPSSQNNAEHQQKKR